MIKTTTTFIFLLFTSLFFAQSIIQDPTFGTDGWTVLNGDTNGYSTINSKVQTDGKILVTGHFNLPNTDFEYFVARLNTDGTLDSTFGTNGYFISPFLLDPFNTEIHLINDKIFLFSPEEKQVLKLNSNGTIDTSFGVDGFLSYLFPNSGSYSWNSDSYCFSNNIYYEGYLLDDSQVLLKRIDLVNGIELPDLAISGISNINGLYEGAAGNLLIKSLDEVNYQIFFSLHSVVDGTMDTTFGTNGKIESYVYGNLLDFEASFDYVERDNNNNIIHGEINENTLVIRVMKYSPTGQLINTFATNGLYQYPNASLSDLKIFNNKIYLCGASAENGQFNFFINRLNNDGSIDTTFNDGEVYVQNTNAYQEIAKSLVVLSDTEFIIGAEYLNGSTRKIFVGKYLVDEDLSSADQIMNAENVKFENPVQEDLKIISEQEFYKVAIYSLNGSLVKSVTNENLNVSDLASGSYLLNIYYNNGSVLKVKMLKK
ncbi:T9SS type A sorting domain-containing protein [Flavobacterium ardleyense]|uniref:T9SS type A sorting domain-containing protein n=1 Tax=Flavobacterium ardleyense TaxID=2038737 RepID=A0ABW5Z9Q7_9FLAO